MTSPARRHFQMVTARIAAEKAGDAPVMSGNAYDMMLVKLHADRVRLKAVRSVVAKVGVKVKVLPEYVSYVDGALAGGRGAQDDVLTTIMLWRIDVGDFDGALAIGEYAIKHNMTLADDFKRDLPTALVEEISDAALSTLETTPVSIRQLQQVEFLTGAKDMHDQVRAKLNKALGVANQKAGELAAALEYFKRALTLDKRSGVKQDIARLEKLLQA
jgi:tetratricopeptide (TPR) repeat protein